MLKKRLVGVVTVKNGWAVQSFGYHRYLPLGKAECLVENLDRWGADEILIQAIDRSTTGSGPDFALLERLGKLGLGTPLIYGGGIRSVADGIKLVQMGADRIVVDVLLSDNPTSVREISERLGAQALIGSLPLSLQAKGLEWFDYRLKISRPLPTNVLSLIQSGVVSEVLISDWQHDGMRDSFDLNLVDAFPFAKVPIIAFGGISEVEQMRSLFQLPRVSAIAVGNFLAYREHAVQQYKTSLARMPLRLATYQSTYFTLAETDD